MRRDAPHVSCESAGSLRVFGGLCVLAALCSALGAAAPPSSTPPDEYIDRETGHKVIRLSRREGDNGCFYFHQNSFTARGDKMVFRGSTPNGWRAFTVDLKTLEVRQITDCACGHPVVAPKRRELFYMKGDTVRATHLDTRKTREIATVPAHYKYGRGLSVNADETLLAGCYAQGESKYRHLPKRELLQTLFKAGLPNALYTIEIKTGKINEFHKLKVWFGHVQFSPTNPTLLSFCHEGPERKLDRIWLARVDGTGIRKIRERTVKGELVTHEFWDPDGKRIWFDLQFPRQTGGSAFGGVAAWARGPHYYLACNDIETGQELRYGLPARAYSWHYNVSADGKLLCGGGEGRDPFKGNVGKWIYLFRPQGEGMKVERLCNLAGHDYASAPNVRFTPDGKWVVFQSKMHGRSQVYAVEVQRR